MRKLQLSKIFSAIAVMVALGFLLMHAQENRAAVERASAKTGTTTSLAAPAVRDMASVPQLSVNQGAVVPAATPRPGVPEAVYRARKAQAASAPSVMGSGDTGGPPERETSQFDDPLEIDGIQTPGASKSHEGLNLSQCGFIPSDGALAVGATYLVQALNNCVLVLDKNTGVVQAGFPKSMNAFFGARGAALFDPRALYDTHLKRFVLMAEQYNDATGFATLWVGISQTSDPRGAWWIYALGVDTAVVNDFPDFPTLGLDKDILYLGATVFKAAGGLTNVVKFLPKAKMYAGQAIGTYFFGFDFNVGGVNLDTVQPANHNAFAADYPRAGFLVASRNINFGGGQCVNGCNGLVVFAVSNALFVTGTPGVEITGATVATATTYRLPPNALQPGCSSPTAVCAIDTGDTRISGQVTYVNGTLWSSLNTKRTGNNTATVVWFQLRPYLNDNNPRCTGTFLNKCAQITGVDILNEDCFFCGGRGNSGSDWFAVAVSNSEGDATMVANYSDLSVFPGTFYVSRRVTQAKNSMHDVGVFLRAGDAFYQILDDVNRNRWGDYNAAQTDGNTFWFEGQYARTGNSCGTRIGRNGFTARNQP